jgi:hypothetical protein
VSTGPVALPSLAECGVADSVTPAAGWVSTDPVALRSLAELGAEADGSSAVVLTPADGLELV